MNNIFLSLGSNMGGREENLAAAQDFLRGRINILKTSSIYETEPVGKFESAEGKKPGWFLNMVIRAETELTPHELLEFIQKIEVKTGRTSRGGSTPREGGLTVKENIATLPASALRTLEGKRHVQGERKYLSRQMDIDILFYNDLILSEPKLIIPHPQILFRGFVLHPLAEIAPNFLHPILKKSIKKMLSECQDTAIVRAL